MFKVLLRKNKSYGNFYIHKKQLSGISEEHGSVEISDSSNVDKKVCNKSGLLTQHRNMLHSQIPYHNPQSWIHLTEKYQRKIFGRYGSESGINPRICFKTKSDRLRLTYEDFADSESIHSKITKYNLEQKYKMDNIMKREEEIHKKMQKLNLWKEELRARINKKEADAIAAKEKKERMIEEVRRHFGYNIDPKDERFKELLERKEKEDKKKLKEAKRLAKEQKLMSKFIEKSATN